jgi:hypothetical protein
VGRVCGIHEREENAYRVWWVNLKDREVSEDLGIDVRIILKLLLRNTMKKIRRDLFGPEWRLLSGFLD